MNLNSTRFTNLIVTVLRLNLLSGRHECTNYSTAPDFPQITSLDLYLN